VEEKSHSWGKETIAREESASTTALPPQKPAAAISAVDVDEEEYFNTPPETAEDLVTEVIHAQDDPALNSFTFRVWFLGTNLNDYFLHPRRY
jgi:hypothetical protein